MVSVQTEALVTHCQLFFSALSDLEKGQVGDLPRGFTHIRVPTF